MVESARRGQDMTKKKNRMHIGTSGWQYAHWKGPFYPEHLGKGEFLRFYAARFDSVEVNGTFYRLPSETTLDSWRENTPRGFLFAVKASRYITHMKKLKDPEQTLPPFFRAIERLRKKLGPILFQLPPKWAFNPARLYDFLEALPGGHRYAFEFRDPSWFDSRAVEALTERGAALCLYELAGRQSPRDVTAEFVYVRLHGPEKAYQGRYQRKALAGWAGAFSSWADQGREVFCYFDNDEAGYATMDAWDMQTMLSAS